MQEISKRGERWPNVEEISERGEELAKVERLKVWKDWGRMHGLPGVSWYYPSIRLKGFEITIENPESG